MEDQYAEGWCWHCGDGIVIPAPRRERCENCPDECDDEGCKALGCEQRNQSPRAAGTMGAILASGGGGAASTGADGTMLEDRGGGSRTVLELAALFRNTGSASLKISYEPETAEFVIHWVEPDGSSYGTMAMGLEDVLTRLVRRMGEP